MAGVLYIFTEAAYDYRKAGTTSGPLVIPLYTRMARGSGKEKMYGQDMINHLIYMNPSEKSQKHIFSKDYGPSKGFRKNGKLRLNMLVYPGPGDENQVLIDWISPTGKWGRVVGLDENKIPAKNITHDTHPWLVHRVYGSNKVGSAVLLKDVMYLPVLSNGRFIEMKFLKRK